MVSGQNAGKASAAKNTDTHPIPPCSTWHSAETLNMHYTVNDHRRHCCRLLRKKAGSPTVLVALDRTAAFDNVDHQQLLDCVINTNIPATIRRWIYNNMQNRRAKVHFLPKESKSRKVKAGVVQGVLSPALFNYYPAYFPTPHQNIKLIKYADDITIYTSGPVVADLINGINIYLSLVLNNIKKTVSTAKSTVTLFTPDTHEHHLHPQVKLADQKLQLEKKSKVLGVMLDTHLTFTQHCKNIAAKVQQCTNELIALASSTLGCNKKTMQTTYQATGRLILSYYCTVWKPSFKDTNWRRLQRAQNSVLRITTGRLKMADVAELHQEVRELPVRQHHELISQQFFIACHLPQHPCHQLCHRPPDDRPARRRSLIGRFKPNILQYLAEEPLINTGHKSAISHP